MKRQTILVTGSCGFIASNFIRYAIHKKEPYNFVSIDKIRKTNVMHNIYSNLNHKFYIGDISDPHIVNIVFEAEKPEIVINMAAESHVDDSIKDPNQFIISNVLGTQVLINACLKNNVERFIQISTDEVYGQLESEKDPSWTEESITNPRNPYSASKNAAELLVKAAHETHGLDYQITRSCNNYGPRQDTSKFIPKIIKCFLNNEKMPIYGKGDQVRDWLYVADNCEALFTIIKNGDLNTIYNISANQEFSNVEIFHEVCNIFEEKYKLKCYDLLKFIEDRKGHDWRYSINSEKIKKLGWVPQWNLKKNGLIATIDWYYNNRWALK